MSGIIDSVHKVFVIRHQGQAMHFDSYKTLDEAAMALLFMDSWQPFWEERIQRFKEALDKRFAEATHENEDG